MKQFTVYDILRRNPCYPGSEVRRLFGKRDWANARNVLRVRIPLSDRLWVMLHKDVLDEDEAIWLTLTLCDWLTLNVEWFWPLRQVATALFDHIEDPSRPLPDDIGLDENHSRIIELSGIYEARNQNEITMARRRHHDLEKTGVWLGYLDAYKRGQVSQDKLFTVLDGVGFYGTTDLTKKEQAALTEVLDAVLDNGDKK